MSASSSSRRATAEIDLGASQGICARIGHRPIYQFWHLVSTQCRGVLLVPQRRTDTGKVAWNWRERINPPPLTKLELEEVRRRLTTASRSLHGEISPDKSPTDDRGNGAAARLDDQARLTVSRLMARLSTQPDEMLSAYICRTESGLMLHSWGGGAPALPCYPDTPPAGISDSKPSTGATIKTPIGGRSPAGWRRWVVGFIALGVLGLGFGLWRFSGPPAGPVGRPELPTGWQSAQGDLATLSAAQLAANARQVGLASGWTPLSKTIPDPSRRVFPHSRSPATSTGPREANAPVESSVSNTDRPPPLPDSKDELTAAPGSVPVQTTGVVASGRAATTRPVASAASSPETKIRSDNGAEEPRSSGRNSTDQPAAALAATRRTKSGGGGRMVDQTASESEGRAGTEAAENSTNAPSPGPVVQSRRPVSGPTSSGTGSSANGSMGAGQTAASGLSASAGTGAKPESTDHLAARRGTSQPERSGGSHASPGVAKAGGALNAAGATPSGPDFSEPPTARGDSPVSTTNQPKRDAVAPAPPAPTPSSDDRVAPPEVSADDPASRLRETSAGKPRAAALPLPATSGETGALPSGMLAESNPADGLVLLGAVSLSAWRPLLLRDVILPTTPSLTDDVEGTENLRQQAIREQTKLVLALFRQAETWSGFVWEYPGAEGGVENPPRWRDANGVEPAGATAQDQRAELAWPGTTPPPNVHYRLRRSTGQEIAQFNTDENGKPVLQIIREGRSWCWVGIERPVTTPVSAQFPGRLEWRLLPAGTRPRSWRQDDQWLGGRGQRMEIPLSVAPANRNNYRLALVDPATGWAIACEVGVP